MSIGGLWHKAKHTVSHTANKVKHKVEHTAKQAGHAAEHAGKEVGKTAKHGVDAVGKVAEHAEKEVNKLVDVGHITDEIKHEILGALNDVKDEAIKGIKSAESEATKSLKKLGDHIKDELEKDLKAIVERLEGQTAKEVLGYLVDVVRTLSPSEVGIQLGPVALSLGNLEKKVEHIIKWAEKPPHNRETWIDFVKDVSPDSLSISASIGFALVVESEDLQIEVSATWNAEDILDNIDDILKKAGIH